MKVWIARSDSEPVGKTLRRHVNRLPPGVMQCRLPPELSHSTPEPTSPHDVGLGNFGETDQGVAVGTTCSQLGALPTGER